MNLTMGNLLERNHDIVHSDMDGETVMMSLDCSAYYGLNGVGTRIWDLLQKRMSLGQICDHLCAEYEVKREDCERHTRQFVGELLEHEVIQVVE